MPSQQLSTDIEKQAVPSVNKPESGTYGEKAELEALQKSLPQAEGGAGSGPGGGASSAPSGPGPAITSPRSNRSARGLEGIPAPMLMPSSRPGEPPSTRATPGPAGTSPGTALSGRAKRLAIADMLANSPESDPETKELMALFVRILTG